MVADVTFHNNDNWIWEKQSFKTFVSTSKSWAIEVRFDLKSKWVYEFSISWMPCMNESNVNNEKLQPIYLIEIKNSLRLKALVSKLLLILPFSSFSSHTLGLLCIVVEAPKFGSFTKMSNLLQVQWLLLAIKLPKVMEVVGQTKVISIVCLIL
jgi:hypothetical protein